MHRREKKTKTADNQFSCVEVFLVCRDWFNVLNSSKVEEVSRAVHLVVELLGIDQL